MADEHSLGPMGPNIVSIEAVADPSGAGVYSVEGHNFVTGFRVEVKDGVGARVEASLAEASTTGFELRLAQSTPGPFTLTVVNPDARTSTKSFATPGTSDSNSRLRADS